MALRLQSMTNVTAPGGNYPYGNVKDDDGSGNGTPVNKADFADMFQFFARLLALGGVVGNDLPENSANTFQYHTALQNIINASVVGLLDLKGNLDASANPNYPAASKGDAYVITVAGKVGGGSGKTVEVGDFLIAKLDNAGGTEASVGTSWFVVNKNIDQATETVAGIAALATQAKTDAGADDLTMVTPLKLATYSRWALKANKAQVAWTGLPLASVNWSTHAGSYHSAAYMIDEFGQVHLRGVLDAASSLTALLSSGWMSASLNKINKIIVVEDDNAGTLKTNSIDVQPDGTTILSRAVPSGSTISLDGVSFWIY